MSLGIKATGVSLPITDSYSFFIQKYKHVKTLVHEPTGEFSINTKNLMFIPKKKNNNKKEDPEKWREK